MGLLDTLKSLFGSDSDRQSDRSPQHTTGTDSDVTIEREPSTATEHAVKGTDESPEMRDEAPTATDEASEATDEHTEEAASLQEIKGIGPTYAGRLEAAGIASVADLAAADAETVADAADATETRATDWIERAQAF
jgi:predicted flap endonuclease-1-like 5' DNA nuclease